MRKDFQALLLNQFEEIKTSGNQHSIFMGGALILLNLFLMSCVGVYWTNPAIHQYISGRPL